MLGLILTAVICRILGNKHSFQEQSHTAVKCTRTLPLAVPWENPIHFTRLAQRRSGWAEAAHQLPGKNVLGEMESVEEKPLVVSWLGKVLCMPSKAQKMPAPSLKQHGEVPVLDQAQFSAASADLGTQTFYCPASLNLGYLVAVRKQKFLSKLMTTGRRLDKISFCISKLLWDRGTLLPVSVRRSHFAQRCQSPNHRIIE